DVACRSEITGYEEGAQVELLSLRGGAESQTRRNARNVGRQFALLSGQLRGVAGLGSAGP
ncbi:hypothetical protein KC220_24395, partial [Mycobacterium tuberculosis]|nr:hypothetical protein [Mycobacterium tuberculosis]